MIDKYLWNDDTILRKSLRLILLGFTWLGLVAFCGTASARPPMPPKLCLEVLREHPEIPEAKYLNIVKDKSKDYQLRKCAGEHYAMLHPESVKEFIELLFERDQGTVRIAIGSLGRMESSARSAVPFLISILEDDLKDDYSSFLKNALVFIGIVDRESINRLLNMAITKSAISDKAIYVLSKQKTLPAHVGNVVIAELDKNGNADREFRNSLYEILVPVRTPKAAERYVERIVRPGFSYDGYYGQRLKEIGTATILGLVDNFRKRHDLDSGELYITVLTKMGTPESIQAGRWLAREMILEDLAKVKPPLVSDDAPLKSSISRIWQLGDVAQPLGKELLALLEQTDEMWMRPDLIRILMDIKYAADALPVLRRLANEGQDAQVRSAAARSVEVLLKTSCDGVLAAHPEIPEAEYLDVIKDRTRIYRLRECAGERYAMRHPESVEEFTKLILDHNGDTVQIALKSLESMGPQARSAFPFLISALDYNRFEDRGAGYLRDTLISIGVVDNEMIGQLLDIAITKRTRREVCLNVQQVLANQKTLPAYVGDAVIARIEKGDNCASLYPILIPVRTPQAIERYIKWTKESVVKPGFLDYQAEIGDFKYEFQRIGPAAIPALVDHFRKHDDLDSRAISVMALMTMQTVESLRAGRKLARQMLSPERPVATKASVTQEQASREEAESRARKLEGMVQLLGRELLVYLYLADEVRMRLELIGALRDIGYTDAVPALRRLADEDRDAEVRAGAAISAVVLERGHVDAKANGSRTPGIKIHENMGGKK